MRRRLRPELQLAVDLAYTYGWRVRDEVLTPERRQVWCTATIEENLVPPEKYAWCGMDSIQGRFLSRAA